MKMIRPILLTSLVAGLVACDSGTSPDATVINVRVRDDIGAPVNRTAVRISISQNGRLNATTRRDGTASIEVDDAGDYVVYVIPSEGYRAGLEPLTRTVTVAPNSKVTVDFIVQRTGVSTADPRPMEHGW